MLEDAFDGGQVAIDFAGYTAESLGVGLTEPLEKVRQGFLAAESLRVRLLLADTSAAMPLPSRVDGKSSRDVLRRMQKTTDRYAGGMQDTVSELVRMGLIRKGAVEIRYLASSPPMKTLLVNRRDLLFGWYPVAQHEVAIGTQAVEVYDVLGRDVALRCFASRSARPT